MLVEKIDSAILIKFYAENDLEIDESHGYFGTNLESFAMIENEIIQGAVTISKYEDKNFLEAIAVDKAMRGKGYGKVLFEKLLEEGKRKCLKELFSTVEKYNYASKRVHEDCGGKLVAENEKRWFFVF